MDLFRALAQKMGFEDECFSDSVDDMIDQALESPNPWLQGITRERLEKEGHIRLNFDGDGNTYPRTTKCGAAVPPHEPFLPFRQRRLPYTERQGAALQRDV